MDEKPVTDDVPVPAIRAVLLDVGDTLIYSREADDVHLQLHKAALRDHGVVVSDEEFDAAMDRAILSFAPNLCRAVNWRFTRPDVELCEAITGQVRRSLQAWAEVEGNYPPPRPGTHELLAALSQRVILVLAGNAPRSIRERLDGYGLLRFFSHTEVSEDIGYAKPDPRFFEHILRACDVPAGQAIMVGDRLDYDIIPAKQLGMKTVWFKTGPQGRFEPRTHREVPDAEVATMTELAHALERLMERTLDVEPDCSPAPGPSECPGRPRQ